MMISYLCPIYYLLPKFLFCIKTEFIVENIYLDVNINKSIFTYFSNCSVVESVKICVILDHESLIWRMKQIFDNIFIISIIGEKWRFEDHFAIRREVSDTLFCIFNESLSEWFVEFRSMLIDLVGHCNFL